MSDAVARCCASGSWGEVGGPQMGGFSSRRAVLAVVCSLLVAGVASFGSAVPVAAAPSSQGGLEAQAASIEAQIQSDGNRLDVLDQQYDQAQQQVMILYFAVMATAAKIAQDEKCVSSAESQLRRQALAVYTQGSADSAVEQIFSSPNEDSSLLQEYQRVASANISWTVDRLRVDEENLGAQESALELRQAQAKAEAQVVAQSRAEAQALLASEQASLGHVKGQIASLVAESEAASEYSNAASFRQRFGAAVATNAPVAPGAAGAVQAAESQLGVPYRWGGEDPGVGFDCSGLTQWSWGRAGVPIPRTAQAQYEAIVHVPMSDLQPGDLVFWDDGTSSIQHVAMYVGNGEVIQAPYTGAVVSYSSIWPSGLVGAGRP